MLQYSLSTHAFLRSAQRNLSYDDIAFIIQHGSRVHRTGVIFCQLRQKDIPPDTPGNHRHRQLAGTTVVLCKCGHYVITLYRNERAFHRDARKNKYNNTVPGCDLCPGYVPAVKSAQTMAIGCAR
jgi:hypothetical protein